MNVELRHLRAFVGLAEELHFGRAAQRLYLTQPALSQTIRQLEDSIGGKLVERTTRSVRLTANGKAFLVDARAVLVAYDAGVARAARAARQEQGILRVGYQIGAALEIAPAVLRAFAERYPSVTVELREFDFGEPFAGLDKGVVDLAFVKLPLNDARLAYEFLEHENVFAGLAPQHRLAQRSSIAIAEILDDPIVAAPLRAGAWRDYWLATEYRGGKPPTIALEAANFDSELQAVAVGKAITITSLSAPKYYARPGVVFVPIHDLPPVSVVLAWFEDATSPLTEALLAVTREVLAERRSEGAEGTPGAART
jgi:DNA-binding transcriptional LysR family regulator